MSTCTTGGACRRPWQGPFDKKSQIRNSKTKTPLRDGSRQNKSLLFRATSIPRFERLSLLVDLHAKRALERLACCYGVTQRAMLERLLMQANLLAQEQAAQQDPDGQAAYFDKRISLLWPVVTR